jgi:hypothetical protein
MPSATLTIKLNGDALALLEDFLTYARRYPEEIADAMYYDHQGFKWRLGSLEKAYKKATR